MKKTDTNSNISSNGIDYLIAAVATIPIWLAIDAYARIRRIAEDEAVATAATACMITGIFMGRYFARLWIANGRAVTNNTLAYLASVIAVSILCLFTPESWFSLQGEYEVIGLLIYWTAFVAMSISFGMIVKLLRVMGQKQLKDAETLAAQSQSELHLLQSQLSPHFLFNTLNNLYGLSITEHERIPPLLLKLSDLLRYSVYEANEIFVPLKDELVYINNYIEFEKIRLGDRLVLTTNLEPITAPDIKIAPMLLIVFIENAFKHAKNTIEEHIYISIELKVWENLILFSVKNSHKKQKEEDRITDKHSGFGLASVNKRLSLLYPGEHELTIHNDDTVYNVVLRLRVKGEDITRKGREVGR